MAIAAQVVAVVRIVTVDVFLMLLVGAAAGLTSGLALVRYMAALFYEVKPTDLAMLASRGYNSAPRNRSSSLAAPGCSRGQNRARYFAERRIEARAHPKEDLGLTSYPSERSVGLNVYPRRARTAGTAARHLGPADLAHADLWSAARPRHRARHPANVSRRAPCGARRALPRPPAARGARLAVVGSAVAGRSVWPADAGQAARLYGHSGAHVGAGHRRKHCNVQRDRGGVAPAAVVQQCGSVGERGFHVGEGRRHDALFLLAAGFF